MNNILNAGNIFSGIFAVMLIATGLLNIVLVHPVPGMAYLILSIVYFPRVNSLLKNSFGYSIHPLVKIILGIVLILFTLGVSDLGDMIDKW